ncbi:MAG: radical SAM protein, partial [Chloroflexi bacterium]|nr:radical SAM protein [Chloroflexota bacterium]
MKQGQGISRRGLDAVLAKEEARKSNLILEANLLKAQERYQDAADRFAEAAKIEERLSKTLLRKGLLDKYFVHHFSALSCWAQAGDVYHAIVLGEELLARADLHTPLRQRIEEYVRQLRTRRVRCSPSLLPRSLPLQRRSDWPLGFVYGKMRNDSYVVKRRVDQVALWQDKKPLLGGLDMELTERCNNNCIHCCINLPADDRVAQERELSAEEVKAILTEAAALGCMQVRFTGGEPLLRPDFEELYLTARRLGMRVLIFTNGRLITPHLADLLARVPPLVTIEITVYGMRAESYEAVSRVPGSFAQFWRGVNLLLERGVPFVVKSALLPPNRGEIDEFEAWAATIPWMDEGPSYAMFLHLRNRRDDAHPADAGKNRLIRSLRLSPEEGLAVLTRDREGYRKGMREFCSKFMGPPGELLFSCGAGHGTCVDAYGQAQMCMGLRHPEMVYDLRADCHCEPRSGEAIPNAELSLRAERSHALSVVEGNPQHGDTEIASSHRPLLAMTPLKYALTEVFPLLR